MLAWPDGTGAFVLSYGLLPHCQDVVGIGAMAGICQLLAFLWAATAGKIGLKRQSLGSQKVPSFSN